jgi:putative tryptophan/tyrosine transport system substrate-binding protein
VLETISLDLNAANFDALRKGAAGFGYIEGQNLIVEYRSADSQIERFPEFAIDLVRAKVDLIDAGDAGNCRGQKPHGKSPTCFQCSELSTPSPGAANCGEVPRTLQTTPE